jgi:hypothetical protein
MKTKFLLTMTSMALFLILFSCKVQDSKGIKQIEEPVVISKSFIEGGPVLTIDFIKGESHNHPSFAVWVEDVNGNLIKTLFVTNAVATGYYNRGDAGDGTWLTVPGPSNRPAALPYWFHKRENIYPDQEIVPSPKQPVPDAYTGATPKGSFKLNASTELPDVYKVIVEVNQPWDWNQYWTNAKFPDEKDYKTSAQPSFIYSVTVKSSENSGPYYLNPIGHGHYSGKDGLLYTDISTMTTATNIFDSIILQVK